MVFSKAIFRSYWIIIIIPLLVNACAFSAPTTSSTPDKGFLVPTRITAPIQTPSAEKTIGPTYASQITSTPFPTLVPLSPSQLAGLKNRVGFGLSSQADPALWAERLGADWYLDWTAKDIPATSMPERWQMVRIKMKNGSWSSVPPLEAIAALAKIDTGHVWIIGNEPDVIWQDSVTAEIYAQAYHDIYTLLKGSDPAARVATAGISQATQLRLAYLDRVLAEYQRRYGSRMPADWWTVHGFVLREEKGSWGVDIPPGFDQKTGMLYEVADHNRLDLFTQQLIAFRKWMADNGYRGVPLALTEYGILMPPDLGFPPESTAQYLQETFQWLLTTSDAQTGYPSDENHLVQRWAWFSLSDKLYPASDLADLKQDKLTIIGTSFENFTRLNPKK